MIRPILDRLSNIVSGLGAGGDKSVFNTYVNPGANPIEILAAYQTSWYGNIVDILAEDSFREWRAIQAEGDQIEAIEAEETRLKSRQKFVAAYRLALAEGGAAILMGGLPGSLDMPVNMNAVTVGSLKWLTVMTKQQITPMSRLIDPGRENFNEPEYYMIGTTRVHPSRVVRLIGLERSDDQNWDGWGDPLWFRLREVVSHLDAVSAGMAALVQEAKIDVFGIPNLAEKVSTAEAQQNLISRFRVASQLKSVTNALITDAGNEDGVGGETYEQKQPSFTGLPDVWDRHALALSGMCGIPQTRLYGRSPQGMNSTGDADEANHAKMIKQRQELKIAPAMVGYDEIIIRSSIGSRPPEVYFEWRSLYSISEKEGAEIEAKYAEAFAKRLSTGAIQDDVLANAELNRMTESGRYPGIEDAIAESDNEGIVDPEEREASEMERMQAEAEIVAASAAPPRIAANDAAPRPLYVRRDVLNKADIVKWAKAQGFTEIVPDLHVTLIYSRTPVDWMKMGQSWSPKLEVGPGGPRLMERFGEATVLLIGAEELMWRNRSMIENGASSDFDEYQPHVTIAYGWAGDIDKVEPYQGKIVLGPEIFEEAKIE